MRNEFIAGWGVVHGAERSWRELKSRLGRVTGESESRMRRFDHGQPSRPPTATHFVTTSSRQNNATTTCYQTNCFSKSAATILHVMRRFSPSHR